MTERPAPYVWLVVAAVAAAYANALGASFQFDDWNVVVRDARVQSLAAWWHSMPGIRPLLKLSYAANHASGTDLFGFHAVNVVIHAANSVLVLALLARLARRDGLSPDSSRLAALTGALIFALHPVQTEAVTYVSGRSSSLSALFALGSVLAAIDGLEKGRRALLFGLSPALFACALGVKEIAVAVPAAILLWCATDCRTPLRLGAAVRAVSGHLAVLALVGGLVAVSPTYRSLAARSLELRAPVENLLVQVNGVSYLAGQLVRFDRLNADPMVAGAVAWSPIFALKLVAVLSVLALGMMTLRTRPALAFGILWFVVWLLPTNSLIARLDVANDRQVYLALAGPAWLVGRWVAAIPVRRHVVIPVVTAAACLLGVVTVDRNRLYADEVRFWEDVVRKTPGNARALNNLGYAYALACRTEDADAAFVLAIDLDPADLKGVANLTLLREGTLLPPEDSRCVGG